MHKQLGGLLASLFGVCKWKSKKCLNIVQALKARMLGVSKLWKSCSINAQNDFSNNIQALEHCKFGLGTILAER